VSGGRARIETAGLIEFQRALKQIDADLPKQLRLVLNEAAGIIVDYSKGHIEVKSGRAKGSIRAQSSQRKAAVAIGGSRAPYVPWLDFGGEGRVRGRPGKRPFIAEGRYVYRGLRLHNEDITALLARGLTELAATAGLEVT
jgi:hypothetical protein